MDAADVHHNILSEYSQLGGLREQCLVCLNLQEGSLGIRLASPRRAMDMPFGPFFAKEILKSSYQAVHGFS